MPGNPFTRKKAVYEVISAVDILKQPHGSKLKDIYTTIKQKHRNANNYMIRDALRVAMKKKQLYYKNRRYIIPNRDLKFKTKRKLRNHVLPSRVSAKARKRKHKFHQRKQCKSKIRPYFKTVAIKKLTTKPNITNVSNHTISPKCQCKHQLESGDYKDVMNEKSNDSKDTFDRKLSENDQAVTRVMRNVHIDNIPDQLSHSKSVSIITSIQRFWRKILILPLTDPNGDLEEDL